MKIFLIIVMNLAHLDMSLADYSETRPSEIFPDDYDKYEPPWSKGSPSHVYIQMGIMDIDKIDDGAMEFSIQCYLGEFWKDSRLNLSFYQNGVHMNPIFPTYLMKYLWVPDLVFDNAKDGKLFQLSLPNTNIKVMGDGSFLRTSRYNLIIGCHMDFRDYPMDTQKCFFKIATMTSPDFKVLLHWIENLPPGNRKSISFVNNIQPLKYTLRVPVSFKNTEIWPSGNYTYLYANFTFDRRLSGSLFNVYVPSTLVVFLSWISFWLEIEAVPARITLGVTSLLTLSTQVVQAHSGLPPISYMTGMHVWLLACLITVFSSLLEFAFSYQLFILDKQETLVNESSHRVKVVKAKDDAQFLRSKLRVDASLKVKSHFKRNSVAPEKVGKKMINQKSLDRICRKLFPIVFFVFTTIYWIYYLYLI